MNTLYLHIGMHKTATTTIQHFCSSNQKLLYKKGYAYPLFPHFNYNTKSIDRNGMFLSVAYRDSQGIRRKNVEKARLEEGLRTVRELFSHCDNVILSDELLWRNLYRRPYILQRLVSEAEDAGYRIRLIIYLRRQDHFVEAMWNQRIKREHTMTMDFASYSALYTKLDYEKLLSSYASLIREEDIIVRRFDDAVQGDGILSDFLCQIGLSLTDEYSTEETSANPRLEGNLIEIKRRINALSWLRRDDNRFLIDSLTACNEAAREAYRCSEFSQEERIAFMKPLEKSNAAVAQRFIRDGRPLFSEDYSAPPKRDPDNPLLLDDIIRSSAATDVILYQYIQTMQTRIAQLEEQVRSLRSQADRNTGRIDRLRHPLRALKDRIRT